MVVARASSSGGAITPRIIDLAAVGLRTKAK